MLVVVQTAVTIWVLLSSSTHPPPSHEAAAAAAALKPSLQVHEDSGTSEETDHAQADGLHDGGVLAVVTVVVVAGDVAGAGDGLLVGARQAAEDLGGLLAGLAGGGGEEGLGLVDVLGGLGADLGPVVAGAGLDVVDEVVHVVLDVVEGVAEAVAEVVAEVAEIVANVVDGVLDVVTDVLGLVEGLVTCQLMSSEVRGTYLGDLGKGHETGESNGGNLHDCGVVFCKKGGLE